MDRVIIGTTHSENIRTKLQNFSFTKDEEKEISIELDRLEAILNSQCQIIFSLSKIQDIYRGSLKIESHDLYAYSKDTCVFNLFRRLCLRVERDILKIAFTRDQLNKHKQDRGYYES